MSPSFSYSIDNQGIAIVTYSHRREGKRTTTLQDLDDLSACLDQLEKKLPKALVFTSDHDSQFMTAFDLAIMTGFRSKEDALNFTKTLQAQFNRVANLPCVTIAAIGGACLGTGLEFALCCDARMATDTPATMFALPDIKLGLIPCAGGTQRLPKLVGLQNGLELILSGKCLSAARALEIGLIDDVVPSRVLARRACEWALDQTHKTRRSRNRLERSFIKRSLVHAKARESVDLTTRGFYPAAYKALHAVKKGVDKNLEKGLQLEAKYFAQLTMTREFKSLLHLHVAKGHIQSVAKEKWPAPPKATRSVGVAGAGFMGTAVAQALANRNFRVRLFDKHHSSVGRAMRQIHQFFETKHGTGELDKITRSLCHVSPTNSCEGLGRADMVIESVFEDRELKQSVREQVERSWDDRCVYATNTSAIPVREIAQDSKDPSRVLGMHFFSPVEKMRLVEIIATENTADWAMGRAVKLGQSLGKHVITVKDGPGFYTTRVLSFYLNEAAKMLMEGAPIDKIDKALKDFGFPIGPLTLMDEVGLDVGAHVLKTMERSFGDRIQAPEGLQSILDSGRLGRKNSQGFYRYTGTNKAGPDEHVYELVKKFRTEPKGIPSDEIVDRCLMIFINECIRCLEDGIIDHPYDGDIGAVYGLGFPPFWGGPFRYIDHLGPKVILDRLERLSERYGSRFDPPQLLRERSESKQLFFSSNV